MEHDSADPDASQPDWMGLRPVRRVERNPDADVDSRHWPATLAPVAQLLDEGLDLGPVTVLVGENGTGKSTIVEAIAGAYGLSPEGGSWQGRHSTRVTESELSGHLRLRRRPGRTRWGYFLRAETMHGLFTYLEAHPGPDPTFHEQSHGESFLAMMGSSRFSRGGFFVFDEPESGLSFTAQLTLIATITDLTRAGDAQVLLATHSPVLAAIPDATLLELDATGIHRRNWAELDLVDHHRRFLERPDTYLRRLLD